MGKRDNLKHSLTACSSIFFISDGSTPSITSRECWQVTYGLRTDKRYITDVDRVFDFRSCTITSRTGPGGIVSSLRDAFVGHSGFVDSEIGSSFTDMRDRTTGCFRNSLNFVSWTNTEEGSTCLSILEIKLSSSEKSEGQGHVRVS